MNILLPQQTYENWQKICIDGVYYFPASSHNNNLAVHCCKCNQQNISASIGYLNDDLCLRCAYYLTFNKNNKIIIKEQLGSENKLETIFESENESNTEKLIDEIPSATSQHNAPIQIPDVNGYEYEYGICRCRCC